jgi:4-hydroxyphenylpyruvate dioxygenase
MSYKCAIASMSLGRAWVHSITSKLDAAATQHYSGIEIFYEDLEYVAKSLPGELTDANQLEAARQIRQMCDDRNLEIICLQPFMHYEGLTDRVAHAAKIEKLKFWFQVAKLLRVDTIQVPSNFQDSGTTGDREVLVADLCEIADLGLAQRPVVKFAYENLCWGKYIDTWEGAWSLVAAVDRPNFGICLDTFNIAGREWADPARADGTNENADEILRRSLKRLRMMIDVRKVFFIQVVDAERLRSPLDKKHAFHVEGQPPRMSWSRNARLFPFEERGYLPILDVLRAITDERDGLGYKGWVSLELFSRTMADSDPSVPREHARRGMESWQKLIEVMGWEGNVVKRVNGVKKVEEVRVGVLETMAVNGH